MAAKLIIKPGKEKPILHRHPWVFSGAVAHIQDAEDGDTVDIFSSGGKWLARSAFNSRSQIAARVWTLERDEPIDSDFFARRLKRAVDSRDARVVGGGTAHRLVNAESDLLPGLVVDRYADFLVVQFLTLGVELHKKEIIAALMNRLAPRGIYERSDVDVRGKEGLPQSTGVLASEAPPDRLEIVEDRVRFLVDLKTGHKTGFYLDQRENRRRSAPYLQGEVLNAFSYTGGFGIYSAARGNARILNLDSSAEALSLARTNFEINGLADRAEYMLGDAFEKLRELNSQGRQFDAIVLDPPKFASSRSNLDRALRGYKDINLLAFKLLKRGGCLVTFSCSGLVSADLFQKVVFGASLDAGVDAQIIVKLAQAPDHPVLLSFPEGEYLKGLVVKVV